MFKKIVISSEAFIQVTLQSDLVYKIIKFPNRTSNLYTQLRKNFLVREVKMKCSKVWDA